jgi:hypothetical protein
MRTTKTKSTNKTKPESTSPADFIAKVKDPAQRADATKLLRMFQKATGEKPVMWGSSIVGFGKYHYTYESGREGDMCLVGFSPRSTSLVLYVLGGAPGEAERLKKLGKHKLGKACLYIKRLDDVDASALAEIVRATAAHVRERQRCDICVDAKAQRKQRAT